MNGEDKGTEFLGRTREWIEENAPLSERTRDFVEKTDGKFTSTNVYNFLQVSTEDDRKAVLAELFRLKKKGVITPTGDRNGEYRLVSGSFEVLDFFNAPDEPLSIELPMNMDELGLRIWEKDLIGIAGVSGDGKSAFFLSLIEANMQEWDIWYLSKGDMCATNLKERMAKSNTTLERWQEYMGGKMINIYGEFADFIKPDAINIIDFLHDADKAYRMSEHMLGIKNKLNNGVAFIALQKNRDAQYGVGRESSMYYTSTYMTIDSGVAKILKARSFIGEKGTPVGKRFQFKLVNGVTFMPDREGIGQWYNPRDLPQSYSLGRKQ